jgi:hypothetical protein
MNLTVRSPLRSGWVQPTRGDSQRLAKPTAAYRPANFCAIVVSLLATIIAASVTSV